MHSNSSDSLHDAGGGSYRNYTDIYDLLDKLCKNLAGGSTSHREIFRHVTEYITNSPTSMGFTMPHDEACLAAKISLHLKTSKSVPTERESDTAFASQSTAASLFLKFYEQLKANLLDKRQRSALLNFLYLMADSKYSYQYGPYIKIGRDLSSDRRTASTVVSNSLSSIRSHLLRHPKSSDVRQIDNLDDLPGSSRGSSKHNMKQHLDFQPFSLRQTESNLYRHSSDASVSSSTAAIECSKYRGTDKEVNDDIVQNILYSFTGIEGTYLKKDVISGKFKFNTKVKTLNRREVAMMMRLAELGYYHDLLQLYTNKDSGVCALGLMGQGLMSSLRDELTSYYGLVALLQDQLSKQRLYGQEHSNSSAEPCERLTMMRILVWAADPLHRLQWLTTIAERCRGKKGGALATTINSFRSNGSPMVKALVQELLNAICRIFYQMLTRWLSEGEINDPHAEFFIECFPEVGPDRLWHDKYRLRRAMLPDFISLELANKILVTGKSINFLREVCEDKQPVKGRDELRMCIEQNAEDIFSSVPDTKLHSTIDSIYSTTSKRVVDIVLGPNKLLEHLQAMRRYLLLGQGDFIGILMENLKSELEKPAQELYSYDLSSIMEASIRSTNAQYDDPEILNHLDLRLLAPCDGDIGWDILSLKYTVRGPLATMLETSMGIYQILFKPLWRMKHMEFILSTKVWKDQKCNAKLLRPILKTSAVELNEILYRLYLYTSEMIHFIHQMQYYILFEVIECSWARLLERVQQAKTLDDILDAHDDYLTAIKCGAFLDNNSGQLCQNLDNVFEGIIRLEVWQDKFYDICFKELAARKQFAADIKSSEETGEFGVNAEKQLVRDQENKIFEQNLSSYHKSLKNIGVDYEKAVRSFLLALNSNNDPNLQLFGIRLDFNEYYKKRDERLGVPLTFEHMRMSNILYNNKSLLGSRYSSIN